MSKNAWSIGCRFVAVAAFALGASGAVAGTAVANDGAAGTAGAAETVGTAGCPRTATLGSTGCHRAEEAGGRRGPGYGRPHGRPGPSYRDRAIEVIIRNLSGNRTGVPLTDPFGFAASRGLAAPLPLRVDPRTVALPGTSSSPSSPSSSSSSSEHRRADRAGLRDAGRARCRRRGGGLVSGRRRWGFVVEVVVCGGGGVFAVPGAVAVAVSGCRVLQPGRGAVPGRCGGRLAAGWGGAVAGAC